MPTKLPMVQCENIKDANSCRIWLDKNVQGRLSFAKTTEVKVAPYAIA